MATNYLNEGKYPVLSVTAGAKSGDFELVGEMAAVLLNDADENDEAVCATEGAFELSVTGEDDAGDVAINQGEKVYWDGGSLNKDSANGTFYGYAFGSVAAGATETIPVKLKQ